MASWLSSLFSKETHVANGLDEDIYARAETDQGKVKESSEVKVGSVSFKSETEQEVMEKEGYTKISPNEATSFYTGEDLDDRICVSIKNSSGEDLHTNHPIQVNRSVIVDEDGDLQMAKYTKGPFGESKIWTDEDGNDHRK